MVLCSLIVEIAKVKLLDYLIELLFDVARFLLVTLRTHVQLDLRDQSSLQLVNLVVELQGPVTVNYYLIPQP